MSSCNNNEIPETDLHFKNNFESSLFWGGNDTRVEKGAAFSGNYYCKIDSIHPYSIGFIQRLGNISPKSLSKLKLNAMGLLKDNNSFMTFEVQLLVPQAGSSEPKTLYLDKTYLTLKNAAIEEWTPMTLEVVLPKDATPDSEIRIFAANTGNGRCLIDDIDIQFE